MAEFKKNTRFSGNNSGGSRRPFNGGPNRSFGARPGGRDFGGPKEMFDAECENCHKHTQVPFRPNGKKPVYCSDCFRQQDGGGDRFEKPRFEKREFRGPSNSFSNASSSFSPTATRNDDRKLDDLARKLDAMNATIEKLVSAIEMSNRASALTKEVRKHVPAEKPAQAPKKVTTEKKTVAKKAKKSIKSSKKA